MTRAEFESLFMKVRPSLEPKKKARKGTSITAKEKFVLTLRYGTGTNMISLFIFDYPRSFPLLRASKA